MILHLGKHDEQAQEILQGLKRLREHATTNEEARAVTLIIDEIEKFIWSKSEVPRILSGNPTIQELNKLYNEVSDGFYRFQILEKMAQLEREGTNQS
jgi:hypothetical protein